MARHGANTPPLDKHGQPIGGLPPPANETFDSQEEPTEGLNSYVAQISTPARPQRQRKQPLREEGRTKGAKAKAAGEAKALRTPALPREVFKEDLDDHLHAYIGQEWRYQMDAWAGQYRPQLNPGAEKSLYGLSKAVVEWLDAHGAGARRFRVNALALLVDPEVARLRAHLVSLGFVLVGRKLKQVWIHPKGRKSELIQLERKLSRWGSEGKGSYAEQKLLKRLGIAWGVWTYDVASRDRARKAVETRAQRAIRRLQHLTEGTDLKLQYTLEEFPELRRVILNKIPDLPVQELFAKIISQSAPEKVSARHKHGAKS